MTRNKRLIRVTPFKVYRQWRKSIEKCDEEVAKLESLPYAQDFGWREAMIEHWRKIKAQLLANPPKPTR